MSSKRVTLIFVRHAQKASVQTFSDSGKKVSASLLSEKGQKQALSFGKAITQKITKGFHTSVKRTQETLHFICKGAQQNIPFSEKGFSALGLSPRFMKEYKAVMDAVLKQHLLSQGKIYEELTLDEQELAMEIANCPFPLHTSLAHPSPSTS